MIKFVLLFLCFLLTTGANAKNKTETIGRLLKRSDGNSTGTDEYIQRVANFVDEGIDDVNNTRRNLGHYSYHIGWMKRWDAYLPGWASDDQTRYNGEGPAKKRCIELGSKCAGITCQYANGGEKDPKGSCTVRKGSNFIHLKRYNEYSLRKQFCLASWESRWDAYLPGWASDDQTRYNGEGPAKKRCIELGSKCAGITCQYANGGEKDPKGSCTVRKGSNFIDLERYNEYSLRKKEHCWKY